MNYAEIREQAIDGDVMLVEGRGFVSRFIRAFTGQNISHVAILIWINNGLYVVEMKERIGFRMMPASQWVKQAGHILYYGKAPDGVRTYPQIARQAALKLRGEKYGYLSLFGVWLSQFSGKNRKGRQLVCSTAIQRVWNACGYRFDQTPDPGDFVRLCQFVSKLEG